MKVKGFLQDVSGASRVTKMRQENFAKASSVPDPSDPIRALADALHPGKQIFEVTEIRDVSKTAKTFHLEPLNGHIPVFQAGQYINFYLKIGNSTLSRPYSISSAPFEAKLEKPFVEVTIRRNVSYLVPDYFFDHVKVGDHLEASMPHGFFYYEPLRDTENVVALAGGSGITPFVSMAKDVAHGDTDIDLTILFGSVKAEDIICREELEELERRCDKIHVVHVLSNDPEWEGEKGFITKELIEKYAKENSTYFFCGPLAMFDLMKSVMAEMEVPAKRFRYEAMSQPSDVTKIPGFPEEFMEKEVELTVVRGIQKDVIKAKCKEPIAVALERAAIGIDTHCRAGECGMCRVHVLSGKYFVSPLGDGRRSMDKQMNYVHSCSAYPLEDMTIKIPII